MCHIDRMLSWKICLEINNEIVYDYKFPSRGWNLDHTVMGTDLLTGTDDTLRAAVTAQGFCIEYRESLV